MSELSTRVRLRREELGLSQEQLAQRMGYRSKSSITKLEKGVNDIPQAKLEELAAALETTPAYLLGLDVPCPPPGFEPLPAMAMVPLVGSIACGTPITAEQNIEQYIGVPAAWHADFALTCHGDSMAPTICDGDIVCIRCQPEVEQGEIAAVRIGEEATLKHFHRQGDTVMLLADNAAVCPPMVYTGPQLNEIRIEGRAVGFCQLGGHSGPIGFPEQLDTPYCYKAAKDAGLGIGSGSIVVMDEDVDPVAYLQKVMEFFVHESCGKCTPCRLGTTRMLELLTAFVEDRAVPGDVERLESLADNIAMLSSCGLGQSADKAVKSCLKHRRAAFEAHIVLKGGVS